MLAERGNTYADRLEARRKVESAQRGKDFVNAGVALVAELSVLQTYGLSGEGMDRASQNIAALSEVLKKKGHIEREKGSGFVTLADYIRNQFQMGDYVSGLINGWVEGRPAEGRHHRHDLTEREVFVLYVGREELRRVMRRPLPGHNSRFRVRVSKALSSFPETRAVMVNAPHNPYKRFKYPRP